MKLLPLLLIFSFSAHSQCKLKTNKVDEFKGTWLVSTEPVTVSSVTINKFETWISRIDSTYLIKFYTPGDLGCASKKSAVFVKFEDGEVVELPYFGEIDCGRTIFFTAIIPKANLQTFKTKKLSKIRYRLDRSWDFDIRKPDAVIKAISCIESAIKPR